MQWTKAITKWKQLKVIIDALRERDSFLQLEKLCHQSNRLALRALQEASRWTPSALQTAETKDGHHPVRSTMEIRRRVDERQFEAIRSVLLVARRRRKQPIVSYPPNPPIGQTIRPMVPTPPQSQPGIFDKSASVINSVYATVTSTRIPLPSIPGLKYPEISSFSLTRKPTVVSSSAKAEEKKSEIIVKDSGFFRPASVTSEERRVESDVTKVIGDLYVTASSDRYYIRRLERLCSLLHQHSWVRGAAIKQGLIDKLIELRWRHRGLYPETVLQIEEALGLLGHHDPPSGPGIRVCESISIPLSFFLSSFLTY